MQYIIIHSIYIIENKAFNYVVNKWPLWEWWINSQTLYVLYQGVYIVVSYVSTWCSWICCKQPRAPFSLHCTDPTIGPVRSICQCQHKEAGAPSSSHRPLAPAGGCRAALVGVSRSRKIPELENSRRLRSKQWSHVMRILEYVTAPASNPLWVDQLWVGGITVCCLQDLTMNSSPVQPYIARSRYFPWRHHWRQ